MGWMASWVAVQSANKDELLAHLGLIDTGREVFPGSRSAPFSFRELPNGWLVVFSEDFDWANEGRTLELSRFGTALACQFEDKVEMTSALTAARSGKLLWQVFHDNTKSVFRLDVKGEPPPEFKRLRDAAYDAQRKGGGEEAGCDFVHDVVHELGKLVCGYRADEEPASFIALRRSGASAAGSGRRRLTLLDKLLAPLRPKPYPVD